MTVAGALEGRQTGSPQLWARPSPSASCAPTAPDSRGLAPDGRLSLLRPRDDKGVSPRVSLLALVLFWGHDPQRVPARKACVEVNARARPCDRLSLCILLGGSSIHLSINGSAASHEVWRRTGPGGYLLGFRASGCCRCRQALSVNLVLSRSYTPKVNPSLLRPYKGSL
jgi:hypothetical protein